MVLSARCMFAHLNENKDEIKWLLFWNVKNDAFRVHFTVSSSQMFHDMMNEIHSLLWVACKGVSSISGVDAGEVDPITNKIYSLEKSKTVKSGNVLRRWIQGHPYLSLSGSICNDDVD